MVSQLESRLGIDLPSTMMFDHPTTSAISAAVASMIEAAQPGNKTQGQSSSAMEAASEAVRDVLGRHLADIPSDESPLMMAGMTSRYRSALMCPSLSWGFTPSSNDYTLLLLWFITRLSCSPLSACYDPGMQPRWCLSSSRISELRSHRHSCSTTRPLLQSLPKSAR